jgi:arabinan endo-1,5-alpha-L-arabinosidase
MQRRLFLQTSLTSLAGTVLSGRVFAAEAAPVAASASSDAASRPVMAQPEFATPEAALNSLYKLGNRDATIHDPSTIVKCGDEYWVFYTGNRSYRSKDLLNWSNGPAVLSAPLPWFGDAVPGFRGTSFWAPDCLKIGDKYFLYYSISAFGKNTSAIGLVTNPTLDPADPHYAWTDQGMVIKSVATDDFNTIDPAITLDFDGNPWLSFGSFWTGIKLIALDKKTGLRLPNTPIYSIAQNQGHATATNEGALTDPINKSQIEASYIYPHDKYYYLFVAWGLCCHGLSNTYNIRVGRSEKITGPYLDKDGKDMLHDGGTLFLGDSGPLLDASKLPTGRGGRGGRGGAIPPQVHAMVGPGHAGILPDGDKFWFSHHYYEATSANGPSFLAIRPLTWDKSGWPVLGEYPDPAPRPTPRQPNQNGGGRRGGNGSSTPAAPTAASAISAGSAP